MKNLHQRGTGWAARALAVLLAFAVVFAAPGCTDLDEETFGTVTPENFYQTEAEIVAALAPVYAQLRAMMWNYHNLSQISSDETVVPIRGSDWQDGFKWVDLHEHDWDPSHGDINGAWIDSYTGVARANTVLANLENADVATEVKQSVSAELRTLRAFYYYQLMDFFGGVPIVTTPAVDPDNPPARNSRKEVFDFIEQELTDARQHLPADHGRSSANFGRVTQGVANAILASMYLNAEIFTGTPSASGVQKGSARWNDAIDAADKVLNSPQYDLVGPGEWFQNFAVDNHASPELIFVVGHLADDGLGINFQQRTLHYHQLSPSPWNGFSTLAETYGKFDQDDERIQIFLKGQAYHMETGEPVKDRNGNPLIFDEIDDLYDTNAGDGNIEGDGIRVMKFAADTDNTGGNHGNDYAFFRLAEILLIKAEALNELNGPNQESITLLNTLRERVFDPEKPLQLSDFSTKAELREQILNERLFELTYEAKRRQDLIRHGKWAEAWKFKAAGMPHTDVFPVPQQQRDANPNLAQNPGY